MKMLYFFCFGFLLLAKLPAQSLTLSSGDTATLLSAEVAELSYGHQLWQDAKQDFIYGVRSVGFTYARPVQWRSKEWLTTGAVALGTFGLYLIEEEVNPFFARQETKVPRAIDRFGFYFGKPQYNYGLTAGIYTIGLLTRQPKWRRTGMVLIASATAAGLIQTVSKTAFGRARPSTGVGNDTFDWFDGRPDYHSFPSGHTVLAVVTAHALAKQVESPWLKGGIYTLGAITPFSRLWTEAHWLSDVGLSVALSIAVVEAVDHFFKEHTDSAYGKPVVARQISWRPVISPGRLGLSATF